MKVGIPREIKNDEYRVAITPAGVRELAGLGHEVFVERDAGAGSAIPNEDYAAAGAKILDSADDVWATGDLLLMVKEPIPEGHHRMRNGQMLFTYLHLAADPACTDALLAAGTIGIAYETVQSPDRSLPLLAPMSEIVGRLAPQVGAYHLMLLLDKNVARLRQMDAIYQGHCQTVTPNTYEIERAVLSADLVIGAVLVPGAKAPRLVGNDLVSRMKPGSVLVDIAIDQGGCFEGSHPTTHADPTYQVRNSAFYCVANMPGAARHTSTYALTNVSLALRDRAGQRRLARHARRSRAGARPEGARRTLTNAAVAAAHGYSVASVAKVVA